uniref:MADF domain-containing protein n=1 Tax=Steinernema glaseri TaxID=37863 RepID=A0A1I8A903_9BILA
MMQPEIRSVWFRAHTVINPSHLMVYFCIPEHSKSYPMMEGYQLTDDQRFEIIHQVKIRPALWSKSEEATVGSVRREQYWDEVAAAISTSQKRIPSRVAKEAFRHMRDAFKKIMKKVGCDPVEAQAKGLVAWRFFNDISYLYDGQPSTLDDDFSLTENYVDELKLSTCVKSEPDSSSRKRNYRYIASSGEVFEGSPGPAEALQLTMTPPQQPYDDGFARYGDLITDVARRLDAKMLKHDLLDFKKAVTDLVHEYEKRMI